MSTSLRSVTTIRMQSEMIPSRMYKRTLNRTQSQTLPELPQELQRLIFAHMYATRIQAYARGMIARMYGDIPGLIAPDDDVWHGDFHWYGVVNLHTPVLYDPRHAMAYIAKYVAKMTMS